MFKYVVRFSQKELDYLYNKSFEHEWNDETPSKNFIERIKMRENVTKIKTYNKLYEKRKKKFRKHKRKVFEYSDKTEGGSPLASGAKITYCYKGGSKIGKVKNEYGAGKIIFYRNSEDILN